jgi:hypothetical protein
VTLIAAFSGYALSAVAARTPAPRTEQLSASGSLTYSWHGDPTRGCAASGVCAVQGALILRPLGGGGFTTFGPAGELSVELNGTARVLRGAAGSPAGECVSVTTTGGLGLQLVHRAGQLVAIARPAPSSGRCAGPVSADLASVTLPVRRTGGTHATFDLRGTRKFTAGPFSGTLDSTLVLRSAPAGSSGGSSGGGFFSSSSSSSASASPSLHPAFVEHVDLRYTLVARPGALDVGFTGAGDPSCVALDTCGASGSLALSVPNPTGTVSLSASRVVRARVSSRQALADFRAGRLTLDFPGFAQLSAKVQESFGWPGTVACEDSSATPSVQLTVGSFAGPRRRGPVPVTLVNQTGSDVLRTRCPGPMDADVVGQSPNGVIARASVTPGELLSSRTVVSLSNPGAFSVPGYAGTRSGAVMLELALVAVHAGTTTENR